MSLNLFGKRQSERNPLYYDLTIREIIRETGDTITIVFDQPLSGPMGYRPGQFLTLIIPLEGKEIRRAYSLCTSPFVDKNPAVTIKRIKNGQLSNWLPDHLKQGDTVKVLRPMGSFTTDYNGLRQRHLIMFAGGSGITPIISIIKSVLTQEPQSLVTLIYCNRNVESIIFSDQLERLRNDHRGKLEIIHVLDKAPLDWTGHEGLLSMELLETIFNKMMPAAISQDQITYWLCGPEGMMKNIEEFLSRRGTSREVIYKEKFVQDTLEKEIKHGPVEVEAATRVVTIRYEGAEYRVPVEPGKHILESALDMGIDLPYSCQSGMCTACMGKALSGEVDISGQEALTQAEIDQGFVLTCIGRPLTDDVVIEIG